MIKNIKSLSSLVIVLLMNSCYTNQVLIKRNLPDGQVKVEKGFFSGIDYLYFEKNTTGKERIYMYYDCECGIEKKIALRKGIIYPNKFRTLWNAVTDTTGSKSFFGESVSIDRLISPLEFLPISKEETDLIIEGIRLSEKDCCLNKNKGIDQIIGFVRVKTN